MSNPISNKMKYKVLPRKVNKKLYIKKIKLHYKTYMYLPYRFYNQCTSLFSSTAVIFAYLIMYNAYNDLYTIHSIQVYHYLFLLSIIPWHIHQHIKVQIIIAHDITHILLVMLHLFVQINSSITFLGNNSLL